jgi:hypothetical protein
MANIRKIARRTFLIGSAAIAGGVAFGVYQLRKDAPNPLVAGAGEAVLTPFILLNQDGVTVIAPRAEMGQGVQTTLAAFVAEKWMSHGRISPFCTARPRRPITIRRCWALPCRFVIMPTRISAIACGRGSGRSANCCICR